MWRPGGPFNQEKGLNPVIKANLERVFHLDEPLWKQYLLYLQNLLQGDFGPSYNLPDFTVANCFAPAFRSRCSLAPSALMLALVIGGALGIIAALNQNRIADYAVVATATAGSTIPTFVIAPLFQLFFALTLQWFPVGGWGDGALVNKVGPVLTLMLPQLAIVARLMRGTHDRVAALPSHPHSPGPRPFRFFSHRAATPCAARCFPSSPMPAPRRQRCSPDRSLSKRSSPSPASAATSSRRRLNRDYTLVMGTVVVIAHLHRPLQPHRRYCSMPWSIRGCAMTDARRSRRSRAARSGPTPGRGLKANRAAMASLYYLALMALACIVGPVVHRRMTSRTIYQDYNRVPPSLSAYPKPETIDLAVKDAVQPGPRRTRGLGGEGRQDPHHRHLRQAHRRAHDALHRPLRRVREGRGGWRSPPMGCS